MSILLYGCTRWMLTKRREKKLDGNYIRMLWAILNKSWRQHPTKQQLYGHLLPLTKIIQIRRTRHAGYRWRSNGELISGVLQWTPSHGRAKVERPTRTYIQQFCADTGCSLEDLRAINDRGGWRERVRKIRASSATWWWSHTHTHTHIYIYIYIWKIITWSVPVFHFRYWERIIVFQYLFTCSYFCFRVLSETIETVKNDTVNSVK